MQQSDALETDDASESGCDCDRLSLVALAARRCRLHVSGCSVRRIVESDIERVLVSEPTLMSWLGRDK